MIPTTPLTLAEYELLNYIHQRIPELLKDLDVPIDENDEQSNYYSDSLAESNAFRANLKLPKDSPHRNVTKANAHASLNEEAVENDVLKKLVKELKSVFPDNKHSTKKSIQLLLAREALSELDWKMPNKFYHGMSPEDIEKYGDPEEVGLTGGPAYISGIEKANKGNELYVSTAPAVAAAYARHKHDRFSRSAGDMETRPTNFGDWIYEILTDGLDPALFSGDDTATPGEILYGPQYKFKGQIPQGMILIKDSAGNDREVPRIRKVRFPSDGNLKDVHFPKHLIDAVSRRF